MLQLNDVEDVDAHLPGLIDCTFYCRIVYLVSWSPVMNITCPVLTLFLTALREWLRLYKSPGGVINEFGYEGKFMSREFAEEVIEETHSSWMDLVKTKGANALV